MKIKRYVALLAISSLLLAGCTKGYDEIELHFVDHTFVADSYWQINKVQFVDALNGMMLTDYQDLHKTTDGGKTWSIVYTHPDIVSTFDYPQKDTAYVFVKQSSYDDHDVIRTIDGGATWSTISQLSDVVLPAFLTGKTGYAISAIPPSNQEQLVRTTNAGITWTNFGTYNGNTWSFGYTSNTRGYLIDGNGDFRITTDGGLNWTMTYDNLDAFSTMSDNGTSFISDYDAGILKTTDYGATWQPCIPSYYPMGAPSHISFSGNLVVGALGSNFVVSRDGGATWTNYILRDVTDLSVFRFDEVHVLDEQHALIECRYESQSGNSLLRLTFP